MQISRVSPVTGKTNTMELDITEEQLRKWKQGALIQKIMPNLTADQREFLMTGMTSEDWVHVFGPSDN
jgi:hypothetical protein